MKSTIHKKILEESQRFARNVHTILIKIDCFVARKSCSKLALMKHAQSRQSMNTKSSKMELLHL